MVQQPSLELTTRHSTAQRSSHSSSVSGSWRLAPYSPCPGRAGCATVRSRDTIRLIRWCQPYPSGSTPAVRPGAPSYLPACSGADVYVVAHGSQLTNTLFLGENVQVVEIMPWTLGGMMIYRAITTPVKKQWLQVGASAQQRGEGERECVCLCVRACIRVRALGWAGRRQIHNLLND